VSTNAQSHPALAIPRDVRGWLLSYISEAGRAKPDAVFWRFARREGYGSVEDYIEASGEPDAVRQRMDEAWNRLVGQSARAQQGSAQALANVRADVRAHLVLLAMPDADFAVALEEGLRFVTEAAEMSAGGWPQDYVGPVRGHVNRVFERRGVPYRVDDEGRVGFSGDASARSLVIEPALSALSDPRMAGARAEFEDALAKLGAGRAKDREDAIEESRKAVESAMKATLAAHGQHGHERKKTRPLIDALRDAGIVEAEADNLLMAAGRVANATASHGSGTLPRDVPHELAAAVVGAAANAITFLTARLPEQP
jgi:hypothetical protein